MNMKDWRLCGCTSTRFFFFLWLAQHFILATDLHFTVVIAPVSHW